MINPSIRQVLVACQRKHVAAWFRRRHKKKLPLSTRQGLILIFGIATFVGFVFFLMYYIWYLPIEKSIQ